jgi:hypothetical protein
MSPGRRIAALFRGRANKALDRVEAPARCLITLRAAAGACCAGAPRGSGRDDQPHAHRTAARAATAASSQPGEPGAAAAGRSGEHLARGALTRRAPVTAYIGDPQGQQASLQAEQDKLIAAPKRVPVASARRNTVPAQAPMLITERGRPAVAAAQIPAVLAHPRLCNDDLRKALRKGRSARRHMLQALTAITQIFDLSHVRTHAVGAVVTLRGGFTQCLRAILLSLRAGRRRMRAPCGSQCHPARPRRCQRSWRIRWRHPGSGHRGEGRISWCHPGLESC